MLSYEELVKVRDKIDKSQDGDEDKLFKWFADNGFTWNRFVASLVTGIPKEKKDQYEKKRKGLMDKLLDKREELDKQIYRDAVEKTFKERFSKMKFDFIPHPDGFVTQDVKTGKYVLKMRWYVIKVYDTKLGGKNCDPNKPHWKVIIKAPGSKTPTSDIDTTISVCRVGSLSKEVDKSRDHINRIKNDVIKYFYEISQQKCGISSSLSRDSNVYHDGFMEEISYRNRINQNSDDYANYGKFPGYEKSDKKGKMVQSERMQILESNYKEVYQEQKRKKHQQEYAASLLPLKEFLEVSSKKNRWEEFKENVKKEIKSVLGEKRKRNKCIKDFEEICDLVNKLYEEQNSKNIVIINDETGLKKDSVKHKISLQNKKISKMNNLYVKKLDEIPRLNEDIKKLLKKEQEFITNVKNSKKRVDKAKEEVETCDGFTRQQKTVLRSHMNAILLEYDNAKKAHKKNLQEYKEHLLKIAKLQNDKQLALIKANIFANEAYINRSAVIHVVEGLQSHGKGQTSKQVIVCSALQQIGLKLLHTQELRKTGCKKEAEIAYRTDKYLSRVNHLFFGNDQDIYKIDGEVNDFINIANNEKISSNKKIKVLSLLNEGESKYHRYSIKSYILLNSAVDMVRKVKKKDEVLYTQKISEAQKILNKRVKYIEDTDKVYGIDKEKFKKTEEDLLLLMAVKLIADGYNAKFRKKKGLWGEYKKQHNKNKMIGKKLKKSKFQNAKKQQKNEKDGKSKDNKKIVVNRSVFKKESCIEFFKMPKGTDCIEFKNNEHTDKSEMTFGK